MKGLLAVARREIEHRRFLFLGAAIAAAAPFVVTWIRGLHDFDAAEVRSATGLALSLTFLLGTAAGLGGTRLPGALADRRIGFDFARPLSSGAIWGGTLLGTLVLAIGSALIAWLPAALAGDTGFWPSLFVSLLNITEIPLPWPVLALLATLFLFALAQAAGVAIRARSGLLAVDMLLLPVSIAAAGYGLMRLQRVGASLDFAIRASVATALFAILALLLAGLAAVAGGRTEIRSAHRAQSRVLWGTTAAGLFALYGYGMWLFSAPPNALKSVQTVRPALRGDWVYVEGPARGADASFLYDTADERSVRLPWLSAPAFSEDGSKAAWLERLRKTSRLRAADLNSRRPSPRTIAMLSDQAYGLVLDASGSRAAVLDNALVSVYDLHTGRLLVSARINAEYRLSRLLFTDPDRLRIYTVPSGKTSHLDILELDVASRRLVRTGGIGDLASWPLLATDRTAQRLVCVEMEAKRMRLFDARTGRLIRQLTDSQKFGATFGFLFDGRIFVVSRSGTERVLEVLSPDGEPLREIPFPGGPLKGTRLTSMGGEASPGQLVVSTGDEGDPTAFLIALDDGTVRQLGQHLRPVSRWSWFYGPANSVLPPGTPAARLFQDDGSLIRVDPATGRRELLLGQRAH